MFSSQFQWYSEYIIAAATAVTFHNSLIHILYWSKYYYFVIDRNKWTKKANFNVFYAEIGQGESTYATRKEELTTCTYKQFLQLKKKI